MRDITATDLWKFDWFSFVCVIVFGILYLHEIMWYIYVQWFRPIDYFVVIVWIFVYMYMKYLLSPLCNKKCYISYNIVHIMNITTHILPMFLRAIKWKCSFLTFDFRHTGKVNEGNFHQALSKAVLNWSFVPHISTQNRDDHICHWGNLSHTEHWWNIDDNICHWINLSHKH